MKKSTLENLTLAGFLIGIVILWCTGCETRRVQVQRPDGTVVTYNRSTLFSESNSEGLQLARDGEDLVLEVGPTGSKTDLEALLEAIKIGLDMAAPIPTP